MCLVVEQGLDLVQDEKDQASKVSGVWVALELLGEEVGAFPVHQVPV